MTNSTVIVLPQTRGNLICVAYTGVVQPDDYKTYLDEPLEKVLKEYDTFRLLVHYTPGFAGWNKDAAVINFRSVSKTGPIAERLAFVNPPQRKVLQLKFQRFIWKAPIRIFNQAQLQEALDWISAP